MRRLLPILLFITLVSCQKDLTEYREYAYGTYWLREDIDGEATSAAEAPMYHFLDYSTFEVFLPQQDSNGNWYDTKYSTNSYYQIFDYEWILNVNKAIDQSGGDDEGGEGVDYGGDDEGGEGEGEGDEGGEGGEGGEGEEGGEGGEGEEDKPQNTRFDQVWDIQKFTKSHLSFRLSYMSDCGEILEDTTRIHNYRKIDKRPSQLDSLIATPWIIVSKDGTECSEKMSITFTNDGKYSIKTKSDSEDGYVKKENEDGTYLLCGKFLRLGSMDNALWGISGKRVLTAWWIEISTKDKVTYMKWENIDNGTILIFSKQA